MKAAGTTLAVLTTLVALAAIMVTCIEIPLRLGGWVGLRERACILCCVSHGGTYPSCVDNCLAYYANINDVRPLSPKE